MTRPGSRTITCGIIGLWSGSVYSAMSRSFWTTRLGSERKGQCANKPGLQFNGHDTGDGELILKHAGKLGFEGVVSKTIDAPYAPGNRGLWRKAKALNRQEFVIVGWSDPEGSRPHLGALLLGGDAHFAEGFA